jgi:DNA ligase-associated metallophosphoesterase
VTVTVTGEELVLLPAKAAYWPRRRTLLIADPHWGKPDTFRAAGVPIATDATFADLDRLALALAETGAERLAILGDLFHAKAGRSPHLFAAVADWLERHRSLDVLLVRGNHDRHAGDPPPAWGFRCESEPVADGPFALRHMPEPTPDRYTLAGHVHPAVTLRGAGRQRLTLPAFVFGGRVGLLPAFGGFTGTAAVAPGPADRAFVVADGEVIAVGG